MTTGYGKLYVVATPIGNLEDITLRAIRILKEVNCIAAEDTRHSQKLLNHFGIKNRLISYYREKEMQRASELIELLKDGEDIALISDAGTPAVSDPGAILVKKALEEEIQVVPIPGVSALTAAVSCSGNVDGTFLFLGFAPVKSGQRQKLFSDIASLQYPVIFYESPRRAQAFLADCYEVLGQRDIFWAREITKSFEEMKRSDLTRMLSEIDGLEIKGELVIMVWPGKQEVLTDDQIIEKIKWYDQNTNMKVKQFSKEIAEQFNVSKSHVYSLALSALDKK